MAVFFHIKFDFLYDFLYDFIRFLYKKKKLESKKH